MENARAVLQTLLRVSMARQNKYHEISQPGQNISTLYPAISSSVQTQLVPRATPSDEANTHVACIKNMFQAKVNPTGNTTKKRMSSKFIVIGNIGQFNGIRKHVIPEDIIDHPP